MPEAAAKKTSSNYHPPLGHTPRSRKDRYKRVHRYVSNLGKAASFNLKHALLVLRANGANLPSAEMQACAKKGYLESEFLPASKVLLCFWIYFEAVDQGADSMPSWLLEFLKLSLQSTDFLMEEPPSTQIMGAQSECREMEQLVQAVGEMIGFYLGYGESAKQLAPAFGPLLRSSRVLRQKVLREALTEDATAL